MDLAMSIIETCENRALAENPADQYAEYFWWKRRAEYIIRLLFAITVDMVVSRHKLDPGDVIPELYRCTLGSMAYVASRRLLKRIPSEEQELFAKIWKRTGSLVSEMPSETGPGGFSANLTDLVDNRNADGHYGTAPEDVDAFIHNVRKCICDLEEITEGRFFRFSQDINMRSQFTQRLVYLTSEPQTEGDRVNCLIIEPKAESRSALPALQCGLYRRGSGPGSELDGLRHQLYLQVVKQGQLADAYYRISPFIEWRDGNIYLYQECLSVLNYKMTFNYILLRPEGGKNSVEIDCWLDSLRPKPREGLYNIYHVHGKRDGNFHQDTMQNLRLEVQFNSPKNPGIMQSINSPYYEKICPKLADVETACRERRDRYMVICGEGGLGKTALVLHIINRILEHGTLDYGRIIFLSAKEKAPNYMRSAQSASEVQLERDFVDYPGLLQKLYLLIVKKGESDGRPLDMGEKLLENQIIQAVNSLPQPKTLLIIDDLDSLSPGEPDKVISLIEKLKNHKLFTLITTRNGKTSGVRVNLKRLDEEQSLDFLCWYLNQKEKGLGERIFRVQDRKLLKNITEGRPYDLLHWANLILLGKQPSDLDAQTFHQYLTPDQKTQYLCRTSLRQVDEDCQILFRFLCEYNDALCSSLDQREKQGVVIDLQFLEFLQFPNLKTREALEEAVRTLQAVCLLEEPPQKDSDVDVPGTLEVRRGIVYNFLLKDCPNLPRYLRRIMDAVQEAPNIWWENNRIALVRYLTRVLRDESVQNSTPIPESGIFSMLVKHQNSLPQKAKRDVEEQFQWMVDHGLFSWLGVSDIDKAASGSVEQRLRKRISDLSRLRSDAFPDAYANLEGELDELRGKKLLTKEQFDRLFKQLRTSRPAR